MTPAKRSGTRKTPSSGASPRRPPKVPKADIAPAPAEPGPGTPFPVVGVGASAGGLEALEELLRHVPEGSGMAWVVVQHLDPTHEGMLPELLQRATSMKVVQVRDRMRVKPGWVYVIPPNRDMSLLHGALHLFEPTAPRGLRLPIDFLFRSLAADQNERSIGVVLSGMGADGTLGLRAIKEAAGLVLVQEPSTAKFDSMPRSAIAAGLADVVAPVQELGERILSYVRHAPLHVRTAPILPDGERSALEKVAIVLRAKTGHDFSLYKSSTVLRRIERRMGIHQIDRIATYVQYLQKNPQEVDLLFRELLIGVTSFFRDPAAWDQLRDEALPPLLANRPPQGVLRAWSTGCSTGEEAFSLAIVFREAVEKLAPKAGLALQVFATDLDADAIARARQATLPARHRLGRPRRPPEEVLRPGGERCLPDRQGDPRDGDVRDPERPHGPPVHEAGPPPVQEPPDLPRAGAPEEAVAALPLFPEPGRHPFPRSRRDGGRAAGPLRAPPRKVPALPQGGRSGPARGGAVPGIAVWRPERGAPPDDRAQARTRPPVARGPGPAPALRSGRRPREWRRRHPLHQRPDGEVPRARRGKGELERLRHGTRGAPAGASRSVPAGSARRDPPSTGAGVRLGSGEKAPRVDVTAQALTEPEALRGTVMIVFSDVVTPHGPAEGPPHKAGSARSPHVATLQHELDEARGALRSLRSEMHAMHEEMQTSQEELKSANEELQSTNEELQSTNEELTTAKEEMQSMNEELQTVNAEQAARMEELTRTSDDLKNLLNGADIATVFLDGDLKVRRFTTGATRLFKLIPGDVGRPLTDVANDLRGTDLAREAREVLRTLVFSQKQVQAVGGRWFEVRVLPYRTVDDRIDGVVMTFVDITKTKALEAELRRAAAGEASGPGGDPKGADR